jgi:hypothetical protein
MRFDGISESDVLALLAGPVKSEPGKDDCTNSFGIAPNGRPIRVTLDTTGTVVTVTTVKRSRFA